MTLIDYRVLVSAPPEIVWELLSHLPSIPKWHVNCTQASILTTQQEGAGVRCRLNMQAGPDIVLDILSWYSNLGYEYTVVDGPYRVSKGRIRLQAIPEGTTVQWTFEYELGGFAASMRDMSTRRRLTNEVEASLKRLKKLVESTGIRMDDQTRERVSLRPAPTAKERAVLSENIARTQPTMKPVPGQPTSSTPSDSLIIDEGDLPPVPEPLVIGDDDLPPAPGELEAMLAEAEPPLEDGDTRPNPAVGEEAPAPDAAELAPDEPTREAEASSAAPAEDDTLPRKPSEAETLPDAFEPVPADDEHPADDKHPAEAVQAAEPAEPAPAPPGVDESAAAGDEPAAEQAAREPVVEEPTLPPPPAEPLVKDIGPSIWEVFGMAPPSAEESGVDELPAPAEDTLPAEEEPLAEAATPTPDAPELDAAQAGPESSILRPRLRQASHPGYRHATRRRTRHR